MIELRGKKVDSPAIEKLREYIADQRRKSIDESLELCARLQNSAPSGSFLCDKLAFVVPDENFQFKKRGTFFLADLNKKERGIK